jgi:hypothetical protein
MRSVRRSVIASVGILFALGVIVAVTSTAGAEGNEPRPHPSQVSKMCAGEPAIVASPGETIEGTPGDDYVVLTEDNTFHSNGGTDTVCNDWGEPEYTVVPDEKPRLDDQRRDADG